MATKLISIIATMVLIIIRKDGQEMMAMLWAQQIMKQETIERIRKFTEDRDWDQFHEPANLAKSIVIEAAELLECLSSI